MSRRMWIFLVGGILIVSIVGAIFWYRQHAETASEEQFSINTPSTVSSANRSVKSQPSHTTMKARAFIPLEKIPYATPVPGRNVTNDPNQTSHF